ncbi:MAG TPA: IS110 family transposase [Thermodesulfobacteriota bacterium]|nr:IS110 family transposase [Thermodesulfobacteriota bacterium]
MIKIETKKLRIVNTKTLMVAVDISKATLVGYCRCPDGRDCKPFEVSNNTEGFKKLWDRICWMKAAHHLEEVVVGFESTGIYGEPLAHFLRSKPVRLVQVNPLHTRRMKDLEGNSPAKTDQKDPKVIADLMQLGHALSVVIPEGAAAQLRRLTQARERSVQRRTALYNQLHDLVFLLFPEFVQVMKDLRTQSAQYLLRHSPTSQAVGQCGLETLTSILKRVSHGKLGRERAQALYEAAQESAGLQEGRDAMLLEMEHLLLEIDSASRFIEQVEREMSHSLDQIPYSSLILSLKGIGEITAAGLIGEVGDFKKFPTASEVEKLAGLDLFEISSGKHKGNRHISKRGRPLLRKLLYFAAMNTVRTGGVMHAPYHRHLERGMPKIKALVAIARKLLRTVFALVRDHSLYIENYSQQETLKLAA